MGDPDLKTKYIDYRMHSGEKEWYDWLKAGMELAPDEPAPDVPAPDASKGHDGKKKKRKKKEGKEVVIKEEEGDKHSGKEEDIKEKKGHKHSGKKEKADDAYEEGKGDKGSRHDYGVPNKAHPY